MIERLRTAFAERARGLQHDAWSSSSEEDGDEFVDVPQLHEDFFKKPEQASPSVELKAQPVEERPKKSSGAEKEHHIHENKITNDHKQVSLLSLPTV
ncbi:unnamed protein product [Gongylonema pulchrum]|uniref:DUF4604 domain-containing protein n=1 Tax=Gongylonema pulchrum TaxID=637853 RepID=A0A183ED24_9BILA|nr:unnamed protein product [Gongylonema pulchrum]